MKALVCVCCQRKVDSKGVRSSVLSQKSIYTCSTPEKARVLPPITPNVLACAALGRGTPIGVTREEVLRNSWDRILGCAF